MKFRSKTLLAKIETEYGVDPVPTGVNGVRTKNLQIRPYQGNTQTRDLDRDYMGAQAQQNTNPQDEITFEVELAGSGTAGTAPAWGIFLRACCMSENVVADTSVTYTPISIDGESIAFYFLQKTDDGNHQIHTVLGCRGTVEFMVDAEGIPVARFTFIGMYQTPTEAAAVTVDNSAYIDPVYVSKENTSLTVGSYTASASAISANLNNTYSLRSVTEEKSVKISERNAQGRVTVDAPALATKDFYSLVESHNGVTTEAVTITHGTLAGNIVEIAGPSVQFTGINPTNSDGELAYQLDLSFLPVSGDDEISITLS